MAILQNLSPRPRVVRGPYLQVVTPHSVTIRWRTDVPSSSIVAYGPSAEDPDEFVSDETPVTEHEVVLTGLQPATRYCYAFGASSDTLQRGTDQYVQTAPLAGLVKTGAPNKIRIWALGDFGNSSQTQLDVRDQMLLATAGQRPDIWLLLGDIAYTRGQDDELQTHFFNQYQAFLPNTTFWPTPGNHDYGDQTESQQVPYFSAFSMPQQGEAGGVPSGSKAYYSFDYGNVHVVSLDSNGVQADGLRLYDPASQQVDWLRRDLTANRTASPHSSWTIVFFHQPPYTKGNHDSDTEELLVNLRERFLPVLEEFDVDLVLSGHSHVYERTHPIRRHYGPAATFRTDEHVQLSRSPGKRGIHYIVAGSGGQLGGEVPGFPHPAMQYANKTEGGSVLIDVEGNRMDVRFVCTDGVVRDEFTLTKRARLPMAGATR